MSKPTTIDKLCPTLTMYEYPQTSSHRGFWLWDGTRKMNLSVRARTREDAFVETIQYYQERLAETEKKYEALEAKGTAFLSQFQDEEVYKL